MLFSSWQRNGKRLRDEGARRLHKTPLANGPASVRVWKRSKIAA